ncbi:MAG TPA: CvpA family protein [Syntrophomonas sp.]|nr:CvpA family protein [Syntrophomonas sp.]HRW11931.1 CvpA family protein [Syntrophomonas sp.]
MMNLLDYLLLGWLAAGMIIGCKKGLVKVIGGLAGTLLGLAAAIIYRDDMALYLEREFGCRTMLVQTIAEKLPQPALGDIPLDTILPPLQSLPVIQNMLTDLAQMILIVGAFLLLYLAVSKGILLLVKLLDMPLRKGALGGLNRLAGTVVMVGKELLVMTILLGIASPIIHNGAAMGLEGLMKAETALEQSYCAAWLQVFFAGLEKLVGIGV